MKKMISIKDIVREDLKKIQEYVIKSHSCAADIIDKTKTINEYVSWDNVPRDMVYQETAAIRVVLMPFAEINKNVIRLSHCIERCSCDEFEDRRKSSRPVEMCRRTKKHEP